MTGFGYEIVNVFVTDIIPDQKPKSAMNDINAAQREQVAASARGEADKILVVKKAEAEAESKKLQGEGITMAAHGGLRGYNGWGCPRRSCGRGECDQWGGSQEEL